MPDLDNLRCTIETIEETIEEITVETAERVKTLEDRAEGYREQLREATGCDCFALRITCQGHGTVAKVGGDKDEPLHTTRILVLAPGQPLREVEVADPLLQVGGHTTELPSWVFPCRGIGVACVGREFRGNDMNASDNFVAFEAAMTKIRGTVIFINSNEDDHTINLTDEQVEQVTKIVGRLERCPAITTERPKDEFHVVVLESEPGQNPPDQRLCAVCEEPFETPWHSGPSAAAWPYPYVCSGACATKQGWSR